MKVEKKMRSERRKISFLLLNIPNDEGVCSEVVSNDCKDHERNDCANSGTHKEETNLDDTQYNTS